MCHPGYSERSSGYSAWGGDDCVPHELTPTRERQTRTGKPGGLDWYPGKST